MDAEQFFAAMYRAHFEYAREMLVKHGVPSRDSEDTAHDLFLALWQRLDRYDRKRPFKCWLFSFIVHFARDYRRRLRYALEDLCGSMWWVPDDGAPAQDRMEARAQPAVRAIRRLAPAYQAVLLMHLEGWTMPEIAAHLGIPLDTGYTRLRRARAQACSPASGLP